MGIIKDKEHTAELIEKLEASGKRIEYKIVIKKPSQFYNNLCEYNNVKNKLYATFKLYLASMLPNTMEEIEEEEECVDNIYLQEKIEGSSGEGNTSSHPLHDATVPDDAESGLTTSVEHSSSQGI